MSVRARGYYPAPALAAAALFGGPLTAVAFAAFEARALGRLRRDLPWLLAGLTGILVSASLAAHSGLLEQATHDLGTRNLPASEHLAYRLVGLALCAGYWLLHRADRSALARAGVAAIPGYAAGLVALLLGLVGGTLLLIALR